MTNISVPDLTGMPIGPDTTAAEQIEFLTLNDECVKAFAASKSLKRRRSVVDEIINLNGLTDLRRDAHKFLSKMVGNGQFADKLERNKAAAATTRGRKSSRQASVTASAQSSYRGKGKAHVEALPQPTSQMPSSDLISDDHQSLPTANRPTGVVTPRRPEITSFIKEQGFPQDLVRLLLDYRSNADPCSLKSRLRDLGIDWRSFQPIADDIRAALEWIDAAA